MKRCYLCKKTKYNNMKNKTLILAPIIISILVLLSSCKPYYKCGETSFNTSESSTKTVPFLTSKRVKTVIKERDSLCSGLSSKISENQNLQNNLSDKNLKVQNLTSNLDLLQKKYNELIDESLSKTEQLNTALKIKSQELEEKERLLLQREKALKEMQSIVARQDSITNRLNNILRDALLGFNSEDLSVEIKNGKVYVSMSDKLLFKSGKADVEVEGKKALKVLADVLNKNPDIDILIEGHTDNVPIKTATFKDNWDLSVARATTIVRILSEEYTVTPQRLTAAGKGEFIPRASNDNAEGRAKNRRTEIILSPKLDELMNMLKTK